MRMKEWLIKWSVWTLEKWS